MIFLVLTSGGGHPITVAGHHIRSVEPIRVGTYERDQFGFMTSIRMVGSDYQDTIQVKETYAEVSQMLFDLMNPIERRSHDNEA